MAGCDTDSVTTAGIVREWHSDEGWGVIDSDTTPGGCWAHFSSVLMSGYRSLSPGQPVSFEFEPGRQDGYAYRAIAVWTGDDRPATPVRQKPSAAYRSLLSLRLEFDAPTDGEATDRDG
jgi:cold shock protein